MPIDGPSSMHAPPVESTRSVVIRGWPLGRAAPVATCVVLVASCLIASSRKWFWNDEIFSFFALSDPSLAHMTAGFRDTLSVTPPLYFWTGWTWVHAFGASEASLRLLSCAGICVAVCAMWSSLHRVYGDWGALFGTVVPFGLSDPILTQNAEARMYGLLLGITGVAVYLAHRLMVDRRPAVLALIANAITHGLLVMSHVFGLLYGAALLMAVVSIDYTRGELRRNVYLSFVVGWLVFLPYVPALRVQASIGAPRGWISPPTLGQLAEFLTLSPSIAARAVLVAVAIAMIGSVVSPDVAGTRSPSRRLPEPGIVLAGCLLAVPAGVWILSRLAMPIFIDRYMIPSHLAWAFLTAHVVRRLGMATWSRLPKIGAAVLAGMILAYPLFRAARIPFPPRPGAQDDSLGYPTLPILVPFSHDFLVRYFYARDPSRYFFVLDWTSAADPGSGAFGPGEFKNLDALRRNYPDRFSRQIVSGADFLRAHPRFLVLTLPGYDRACTERDFHCPRWLQTRILQHDEFRTTRIRSEGSHVVLLVVRNE